MRLALFDADGTLYTAQYGRGLMQYMSEHGRKVYAQRYYASIFPSYTLYKLKLGRRENMQYNLIANLSRMLQGLTRDQAQEAFVWLMHEYVIPTLRDDVIQQMKELLEKGHKVVMVSGMLQESAELFRNHFQTDGAIGTQPEFKNGRYTGRTVPPAINGSTKATKVHEFVQSRGWDIDWTSSYAYGDSFTDHFMMELVGNPVAVYPDKKLLALAKEKNWKILGTPKEK